VTNGHARVVAEGYDAIATRYAAWSGKVEDPTRARVLSEFSGRLADGARVLDLGCGSGFPSTADLTQRFRVTGVDISIEQIRLARTNVPAATFIHDDLSTARFGAGSFEGVVALYSIIHVARDEHATLFRRIASWLVPGGLLAASLTVADSPDQTGEWLGVPMFFSGYDAATNRSLLRGAGFELLVDEVVEIEEPEGAVEFLWVLGRKTASVEPAARRR